MNRLFLVPIALLIVCCSVAAQEGKPLYTISVTRADTSLGQIVVELFPDVAPLHVRNFDSLVAINFFDSVAFHRVIPGFVIQGGDPNTRSGPESSWGVGDPSQTTVPAEFSPISHQRGILSAARKGGDNNSATSQFFIVVANASNLDNQYTVYGRVVSGMDVVDMIVNAPTVVNQFGEKSKPAVKITMMVRRTGTDTTKPAAPAITGPVDDTTRVRGALPIRWAPVDGAILYRFEVSTTPDFTDVLQSEWLVGTLGTSRFHQPGRNEYYYRVRASNGGVPGEWSEVRSFTTGIATPALRWPTNSMTQLATSARFRWGSAAGATSYRIQVGTSLGFTTIVADQSGLTDTTADVTGLEMNTRYFWRILATDGAGDTSVSTRWSFTTGTSSGVDIDARDADMLAEIRQASADRFTLHLAPGRPSLTRITVVDALGREVMSLRDAYDVGDSVVEIDASALASGVYFVRIESSGGGATRRFVVMR
jgi:peptidyl-prolyl cis-trans isomerase B (cyclophilin B)